MSNPPVTIPRAIQPYEGWGEKFSRKVKENPWVPLGCLATVGALVMSAVKMRAGKSKEMNHWMRARVGLQGVTLVALVVGTMSLKAEKEKAESKAALEAAQEQVRLQDKAEFEARLRNAEAVHSQEVSMAAGAKVGSELAPDNGVKLSPSGKSWWKVW